jgi:hypothetical protein
MAVPDVTLTTVGADEDTGSTTIHKKKRRRVVKGRASRKGGVVRLSEEADRLVGEIVATYLGMLRDGALKGDRADAERLIKHALLKDSMVRKKPRAEPVKKPRAELVKKPRRGITSAQELQRDLLEHEEWRKEVEKESREMGEEQGIGEVQGTGNREQGMAGAPQVSHARPGVPRFFWFAGSEWFPA